MNDVIDETAELEAAKERRELTAEQKQAAGLRREAQLLEKHGITQKAAELRAQADALAPAGARTGRVNPLTELSQEEQKALKDYFRTSAGFARLCGVVSYKKLAEILEEVGNGK